MKVYMVVSSRGDYEDYSEHIEKAYTSEAKAIEFMDTYNKELMKDKAECRQRREQGLPALYGDWRLEDEYEAVINTIDVEE